MDYKSSDSNKALSFVASVFFHAAFVCLAAFLPLYFSTQNQEPKNVNELDVAVVTEGVAPETGATPIPEAAPEAPTREIAPTPAPQPKAEVQVTQSVVKPKPVEAIKEAPKKKTAPAPKRVMMAKSAATETEEESQPVIEVADQLNEDGVNSIDDSKTSAVPVENPVAVKEEVKSNDIAFADEAVKSKEAAPATAAPIAVAATPSPAASPAPIAKSNGTGSATGSQSGQGPATSDKPQNFLSLKQASGNTPPYYTREMRIQKLEGKGQLSYYVGKDGRVSQVKVNKSSGVAALDQAALSAFSKYKFVPGQEGFTVHNYEFTLQGPAEVDGLKLRTTYQEKK